MELLNTCSTINSSIEEILKLDSNRSLYVVINVANVKADSATMLSLSSEKAFVCEFLIHFVNNGKQEIIDIVLTDCFISV